MKTEELFADLHIHTNYSDGSWSPSEAVKYAKKLKLSAISITDHDCVDGIDEAIQEASKSCFEVIPGIELSAQIENSKNKEIHILGYYIDYKSESLKKQIDIFKRARAQRADEILNKLQKAGIILQDLSFMKTLENKAIGRLHFAKALIKEGFASNVSDAFNKYLSFDKAAYVPKHSISPAEAIKLILDSGGIPVIAHPYFISYADKDLFRSLAESGLKGIEVWHTKHPEHAVRKLLSIAKELDLLVTGGSDCHGPYKDEPPLMGKIKVPYKIVESLIDSLNQK
jgi:predicted metal-dependent phosphoesterase TrpH